MFRYYPGEAAKSVKSITPVPLYPPGYTNTDTLPANYHTQVTMPPLNQVTSHYPTSRSRSSASLYSSVSRDNLTDHAPDLNTFVDYKKVVGQLENSKFY